MWMVQMAVPLFGGGLVAGGRRRGSSVIRMGGGPRTYPGGVSKWQWKRMQAKKAKQLLKARLSRERQVYEMRKRAELKAAASELERPWDVVERPPNLFSVPADEQLKALADRFHRPGGLDLWTHRDGPHLLDRHLPSARFFPKGAIHSASPYAPIVAHEEEENMHPDPAAPYAPSRGKAHQEKEKKKKKKKVGDIHMDSKMGKLRRKRVKGQHTTPDFHSQLHDMSLQGDGTYGLQHPNSAAKEQIAKLRFF